MEGSNAVFDVIVVGAGIEGSATAYNLAKNGKSTLLLEQVINLIRFCTCIILKINGELSNGEKSYLCCSQIYKLT